MIWFLNALIKATKIRQNKKPAGTYASGWFFSLYFFFLSVSGNESTNFSMICFFT